MKLTIIIPTYNHLTDVLTCLNALQALAAGDHDYLVQDDASTAYLAPAVIPPSLAQVERNAHNLGFVENANAGARRAADSDVLFFVNQDVYGVPDWSTGWDAALLAPFSDPQVGIVGARLLFPDGSIQSAGGLIDAGGAPFHRCLGYSNPQHREVATRRPVTWVTGAALAIRRDLFEQIGGFDPHYAPSYFEDVDACLKVRDRGYTIVYEPACTLIHRVGSTGGSPQFGRSAHRFAERWVASGRVTPDVPVQKVRYW